MMLIEITNKNIQFIEKSSEINSHLIFFDQLIQSE